MLLRYSGSDIPKTIKKDCRRNRIIIGSIIVILILVAVVNAIYSNSAAAITSDVFLSSCESKGLIVTENTEKDSNYNYDKWVATPSDNSYLFRRKTPWLAAGM